MVVRQAYHMVRERLDSLPSAEHLSIRPEDANTMMMVDDMAQRCHAIEESTRIIWACAASLGQIEPEMFEGGNPEFKDALTYFWELKDLEWMELTHHHRILWEKGTNKKYI
jgi:hypothetical protein